MTNLAPSMTIIFLAVAPLLGRARKPRPRTCGVMLDKMSKSQGGARMRISVAEGNRRPHDLVQATKFALEVGE